MLNTIIYEDKLDKNKNYNIYVGKDIIRNLSKYISNYTNKDSKIVIITDDNVNYYYNGLLDNILKDYKVYNFIIPNGEQSKSEDQLFRLFKFLLKNEITRNDILIAFGGGVVGDLTGLCASIYMRGIKFIQIPTTLLSMVDSSIGGKTAINIDGYKNVVGSFYVPKFVLCDISFLNTLPEEIYRDGFGEIIKYGIIKSPCLFNSLFDKEKLDMINIITESITIKRDIVQEDLYDNKNIRILLNLGHTIGHTFENLSNFKISHGESVAIGILYASYISTFLNIGENICKEVNTLLDLYGFNNKIKYKYEDVYNKLLIDKKRNNNIISLVLPIKVGECKVVDLHIDEIKNILKSII